MENQPDSDDGWYDKRQHSKATGQEVKGKDQIDHDIQEVNGVAQFFGASQVVDKETNGADKQAEGQELREIDQIAHRVDGNGDSD